MVIQTHVYITPHCPRQYVRNVEIIPMVFTVSSVTVVTTLTTLLKTKTLSVKVCIAFDLYTFFSNFYLIVFQKNMRKICCCNKFFFM